MIDRRDLSGRQDELVFSIIVPVYDRPEEVDELLASLSEQTDPNFDVVIVEDGSKVLCDDIVKQYSSKLSIQYYYKANSGPGGSRNYGMALAKGNYFIILDSDCIIPSKYISIVRTSLQARYMDAYGGPDKALPSFTPLQKAINYSMTSFFTTGGIRGGGENLDKFFPRSFNMGISLPVFKRTGGFADMRFGEDIDLSIRLMNEGFSTGLIKEAFVFHKRRTKLSQYYKQVHNSGIARIHLSKKHAGTLKPVHLAPTVFVLGTIGMICLGFWIDWQFLWPLGLYVAIIFVDSLIKNKDVSVALLSIVTSFVQLIGYGLGFIRAFWEVIVLGKSKFVAFERNFYK